MGAGHYAVALMLRRAEPRINAGLLFFCAIFADFLLGILVLAGIEEIHIPPSYAIRRYYEFTFPYSHGLLATLLLSVAAMLIARRFASWRVARIIAFAVISHFVLDVITHVPELPLAGDESKKFGLALWRRLDVALSLEAGLVFVGVALYRRLGMAVMMLIVAGVMIGGQAFMTRAASPTTAAVTWIVGSAAVSGAAYLLDRRT